MARRAKGGAAAKPVGTWAHGILDAVYSILGDSSDPEDALRHALAKLEKAEWCSFAIAFRKHRRSGAFTAYNLPADAKERGPKKGQHAKLMDYYISDPLSEEGAPLLWDVMRRACARSPGGSYVPRLVITDLSACGHLSANDLVIFAPPSAHGDEGKNDYESIKTRLATLAARAPQQWDDEFRQALARCSDDKCRDNCVLERCAAWATVCGDVRYGRSVEKRTRAVAYTYGTRDMADDVERYDHDYCFTVGLTLDGCRLAEPDMGIFMKVLWAAWNILATPIFIQDREDLLRRLAIGGSVIHTLKNRLAETGAAIKGARLGLAQAASQSARTLEQVEQDLALYTDYTSFVLRAPFEDRSQLPLHGDTGAEYCAASRLEQIITRQLAAYNQPCRRDPSGGSIVEQQVVFADPKYLELGLAELSANIAAHGCREHDVLYAAWYEGENGAGELHFRVSNVPQTSPKGNALSRPSRGKGMAAFKEFVRAAGGECHDPVTEKRGEGGGVEALIFSCVFDLAVIRQRSAKHQDDGQVERPSIVVKL